jgi:hypothetical protein
LKLEKLGLLKDKDLIPLMIQRLIDLRSPLDSSTQRPAPGPSSYELSSMRSKQSSSQPSSLLASKPSGNELSAVISDPSYWCWGYSFPWQTRTILVPRGAPNLVSTTFVANALLDAHEWSGNATCLDMAISAARYIQDELYWTDADGTACFAYPVPTSRARVHNANLLGAALLCRVYKHTGDKKYLDPAVKVARYSAAEQRDDGSWDYGEDPTQRWIDNFHTGYNLCALKAICKYADTAEFEPQIRRGFEFYQEHFFAEEGAAKYFHDRTYPIDIHSVAQSIITLVLLKNLDEGGNNATARSVLKWAINHMLDERGYFYYQIHFWYKTKISYMRWSQAWMLLALATLLEEAAKAK